MPRPVIGLNVDHSEKSGGFYYVSPRYLDAVAASEGIPVLITPSTPPDALGPLLDTLDGFILIGGADIDPRRNGWNLHDHTHLMDARRECFDRILIAKIASRFLPVLGIGAGMQLLNVSRGGNLSLHIPDDNCEPIAHWHPTDKTHRHAIRVRKDSLVGRAYEGCRPIIVSSMHHQAVDDVAEGFRVTARCNDGVTEAIESTTTWLAVGTQFHCEMEPLSVGVIAEFIAAAVAQSARFKAA